MSVALSLVILVSVFLQYTRLGKAMRATSDNFQPGPGVRD